METADKKTGITVRPQLPEAVPGFKDFGHVPLKSVHNCRDLGGMPAADGKHIRPGRLLRSASLHAMTPEDANALLDEHALVEVVDFRMSGEVDRALDKVGELPFVTYRFLPVLPEHRDTAEPPQPRPGIDAFSMMETVYRTFVTSREGITAYTEFLNGLLERETGATLWHCTQGKDRTGTGAMLVEHALGVSEEDIRRDYLATNLFADDMMDELAKLLEHVPLMDKAADQAGAALFAYPRYLDTELSAIKEGWGSVDAYLDQALDFGPDKRARLRELYLA